MLTVVGLGAQPGDLTVTGLRTLREADEVIVRTSALCPVQTLDEEGIAYSTLDFLYEKSRSYDTLVKNIVKELKARARDRKVCYCVDGSVTEDAAARLLLKAKDVEFVDGGSKAAWLAANAGLFGGFEAVSAFELREKRLVLPLVVYDLTEDNAGDAKLLLSERFGDEAEVVFFSGRTGRTMPLYEIDRERFRAAGLVIKEIPLLEKKRFDFEDALDILRRLRAPDGCPWDKVQTHESIRVNAIEEAYELVDAIDCRDPAKMCEEAGDVLMQAAFHALIEEEAGGFTPGDMLTELCTKLITRHTHVFGADRAAGAEGALSVWEKNKSIEKHRKSFADAVNDVPECFPALLRAQKIAGRVEKGGWDKASFEAFEEKFREEYLELKEACRSGDRARIGEELGDALFCTAELGRAAGADCEMALLDAVKKVQARYTKYEELVRADGKDVLALSKEEKDEYYRRAKNAARA